MPVKPKIAAMMAMMKNASAQLNMTDSFDKWWVKLLEARANPVPV
jgi:hypothetical protein